MWVGKVKGAPGERGKGEKTEGNEEKKTLKTVQKKYVIALVFVNFHVKKYF